MNRYIQLFFRSSLPWGLYSRTSSSCLPSGLRSPNGTIAKRICATTSRTSEVGGWESAVRARRAAGSRVATGRLLVQRLGPGFGGNRLAVHIEGPEEPLPAADLT